MDLLIDPSLENERRVFDALATLPDGCVRQLDPGDVAKYTVVRVADEILVDLMASASGICECGCFRAGNMWPRVRPG